MKQAGRLAAVLGITVSCIAAAAPAAFAADVTVRPADLAAGTSWVTSPFNTAVAGIGALADPIHFDGSAHLQVGGPTERAQLALPLDDSLAHIAARPLSYQVYVDQQATAPAAAEYGIVLQLQVSGPTFTTLSFQPQLDGGAAEGAWRTFTDTNAPVWRTSRDFGTLAAGSDNSLAAYLAAVPDSHVNAAFLNIGTGAAALNAYADNVAVDGNTYNFATAGSPTATITAPSTTLAPRTPTPIHLTFSSPADGPEFRQTSALVTVTGPDGLRNRQLILRQNGTTLALTRAGESTYTAHVELSADTLSPGTSLTADLSLLLRRRAPCGTYVVSDELLTAGAPTNLSARQTFSLPCSTPTPPPTTPPTHVPTAPSTPNGPTGPGRPTLPSTGAFATTPLIATAAIATGLGGALTFLLRRRGTGARR